MKETNLSATPARQHLSPQPAAIDKDELRRQIDGLVMRCGLEMVQETINQVNEGHYQALKYLFEMIGLYPDPAVSEEADDSVALQLLKRFGLEPPKNTSTQPTAYRKIS